MKRLHVIGWALAAIAAGFVATVIAVNRAGEDPIPADAAPVPTRASAEQIARGAYLARAANCVGCHTAAGGAAMAGGVGIATPFGTVYASNLTPDDATGIGTWSSQHFWRALHNGRAKDGRLLYPAFPYTSYTRMTREDADAVYAYLRSLPPVAQASAPHALRFPYDTQAALMVWRALFFRVAPATPPVDATRPVEWQRGAYLVQALGHCVDCHASRNILGAVGNADALSGGLIPTQNWYAPSLSSPREAGVADWPIEDVMALLRDGTVTRDTRHATVAGPMAQVVFNSTRHLAEPDLRAMAVYLKSLPPSTGAREAPPKADAAQLARGESLYGRHCIDCHGATGEGARDASGRVAYPPLAGNRAVTMDSPANGVQVVLRGGFAPTTAANPRPYGMPPFAATLDNEDVAAVLSYVRTSWGNDGAPVSALEVTRLRR